METNNQFEVITGRQVTIMDIQEAGELEKIGFPGYHGENIKKNIELFKKNQDIFIMIRNVKANKIIAYVTILPISKRYYNEIKRRSDSLIFTPDMILKYNQSEIYCVYLYSVVVHPKYRTYKIVKLLFDSCFQKFLNFAKNNIFFKKVLAYNINSSGVKFDNLIGMKPINYPNQPASNVYEVSFLPPEFRITTKQTKMMFDIFKKHYQETIF